MSISTENTETFVEQRLREEHERIVLDDLMPGLCEKQDEIYRAMMAQAANFYANMERTRTVLVRSPQARLEAAARLLNMPAPIISKLIADLGGSDVEAILVEIERSIEALRKARLSQNGEVA